MQETKHNRRNKTLKKWSHFDIKSWVDWTKIRPGIPSNLSLIDSILRVNLNQNILQSLRIPGRILVPPVTQVFR